MLLAVIGVVVVFVLTLGTAVFVAAEFALVAVDRTELEAAARHGDRAARRALAATHRLSFQLSGAQLGITISSLAVGFLAEPSISTLIRPALSALGLPTGLVETAAVAGALLLATLLQILVGELIPKNWAIARPLRVARRVAAPMRMFTTALRPVIAACNAMANRIVRSIGVQPQEQLRSARSPAELDSLVRASAEGGTLPQAAAMQLSRALSFAAKTAAEVMTPRTAVVAVPDTASVSALLTRAAASGHSRLPVAAAGPSGTPDLDALDRVAHVKHGLAVSPDQRAHTPVREVAAPLPQVPERLGLEPLLALLRRAGLQMAAVIDEYGGTAGIVTVEDLVEEIVGAIRDEHDPTSPAPVLVADGSLTLPGQLRLDEVAELAASFAPPLGPYDTLAGLVLSRLGRLAQPGDQVEIAGWTLTVIAADGRRIATIQLRPPAQHRSRDHP